MKVPSISIVVPTKDSEKTLSECLESIKSQTCQDFELIVVDGRSKDSTLEIAKRYTDKLFYDNGSLPGARNIGFSKARGSLFLSIDSDMVLDRTLLQDILERMDDYGALIIPEVGLGEDYLSRCKDLEKRCYVGDPLIESARVFSRAAFEAVKGYDETLHFAEDWDLHSRIQSRFSIGRTESRLYHNTKGLSMVHDLRKSFLYGKTLPSYLAKNDSRGKEWLRVKNFFFIRNAGKLAHEPLLAVGLIIIKGTEYFFGFLGFISSKLRA